MDEDPTRWLSAAEQDAWIPLVTVLLMLPGALDSQLQRDAGLTFYEYVVLAGLSERGSEGLRMSDLAAVTSASQSRLSQVVSRMEARGWVERAPDPCDGRATRVQILADGRSVLETAAPRHVDNVRRLVFDQLTPAQVGHLERIALRIASTLVPPDSLIHARETLSGGTSTTRDT